jgi:hypothetical protein
LIYDGDVFGRKTPTRGIVFTEEWMSYEIAIIQWLRLIKDTRPWKSSFLVSRNIGAFVPVTTDPGLSGFPLSGFGGAL